MKPRLVLFGYGMLLFSAGCDGIELAWQLHSSFWFISCSLIGCGSIVIGLVLMLYTEDGTITIKE